LHLARAWKIAVDEAAIAVRLLVEISNGWQAKVCEAVTEFLKVFLAQHLRFSLIGTPSHAGDSTVFRCLFATAPCRIRQNRGQRVKWPDFVNKPIN
jgi:hypothetical protein